MNTKKRANQAGIKLVRMHNPVKYTLGMPGERRKNMATKRRKVNRAGSRRKRRNTARVGSQALAPYRAAAPAKRNPRRRHHNKRGRRRNPGRAIARRSNPLGGGKLFGLGIMDLVGGAVGLVGDELIAVVAANFGVTGAVALVVRGAGAVAMVKFLPKSIGPAAGLVAGAKVVKSAADQYLGLGALQAKIVGFIPMGTQQAAAGASGYTTG